MKISFCWSGFEAFNCFTESGFLNFGGRSQNVMWFWGIKHFTRNLILVCALC